MRSKIKLAAMMSGFTFLFGAGDGAPKPRPTSESLGGKERYLTALSTDKPIYRPGEMVYARGVVLHAFKRTPLPPSDPAYATVEIKGPKGDTVSAGSVTTQDSVWAFSWQIPAEQAGGEYTIHATYPWSGHAPAERKFDVRVFRAPRLKSQIVFLRDGYGPGDKVTATLEVKRAEGGVPSGAKVTAIARVDEQEAARVEASVDPRGFCTVSFDLPRAIARGEGSLAFSIEDGGVVETAAKTIPILLQTVDLSLYPEGGRLIAGVLGRVYFEARTPAQKPADVAGEVLKDGGARVVRFKSEHEGRGRFSFTPEPGARYTLRLTEPTGIKTTFPLPAIEPKGAVIRALEDTAAEREPVKLRIDGHGLGSVKVTLSQREIEVASAKVDLGTGKGAELSLDPKDASGVLVATVWDEKGLPLAERLVYRRPSKALEIEVRADRKSYAPGDTVKLTAKTTEGGKPISAVVGLTVTDDAVLELIEKREQAPQLPVMVLLEPEVKDLADAHVYLDPKNPKAPLATDLLLGTQGWRRFMYLDPATFIEREGDRARRVLALRIQAQTEIDEEDARAGAVFGGAPVPAGAARRADDRGIRLPRQDRAPRGLHRHDVAIAFAMPAREEPPAPPPVPMAAVPMAPAVMAKPMAQPRPEPADKLQAAIAKAKVANKEKAIDMSKTRSVSGEGFIAVREFAHQARPGRQPTDRVDFTETLFWNAGVRTDPKTGEATVTFALNDGVTSFKAFAGAFSDRGAIGSGQAAIESVQPFYVEPKLPLEVTSGDLIRLPVSLVNQTSELLCGAKLEIRAKGDLRIAEIPSFDLSAGERKRRLVDIQVGLAKGPIDFDINAGAGSHKDHVTRKLSVKPKGFPFEASFGGMLAAGGTVTHQVTIPLNVVAGSMRTNIAVYPTPLANLTEALTRLIQDPNGCFEQTSSTSYPLTMAQQYFMTHTGVDPKLVQLAQDKLDAGYKRLVGFETKERGYEWFGENPGHEALTAYGILHFTDMAKVRSVDQAMLERSREWLMKQRDGKGGFERKRRALHTWIEDRDCSNGYITWALLESGQSGLDKEVRALKEAADASKNSYVLALAANALYLANDKAAAKRLMDRLASKQSKTGAVDGGTASIVGSGGEALEIETTSLAVLAWLRDPAYAGAVEKSIRYLADSCKNGRYGSTQSTVLALRAIVAYDQQRARPKAPGSVRVYVDGQPVGSPVPFDPKTEGAIKLPDVSELLSKGSHKVELKMQGGGEMPYAIGISYNALVPESSKDSKVGLETSISKRSVTEGEIVEVTATLSNRTREIVPTPVAIIGLPGGLEPRHDQLKELVKQHTIDAYEVIGREVVLYWRGLEAQKKVRVPLSLVAAVPGTYTAPASRAYLYYTDEHKSWVDGLAVTVAPKR